MDTQTRLVGFGNERLKKKRKTRIESGLSKYDKSTFAERLDRLKTIRKIYPTGHWIVGEPELVYTFSEAKDCFIAGHFISTIVLTQSFVEKVIHGFFIEKGLMNEAKKGLDNMIKYSRNKNLINPYLLDKINLLRQRRNPFTHLKNFDYPHRFTKRMIENRLQPHEQLEKDAFEALQIMFLLSHYKF
jgi:hypothetical protein